MPKIITGIMIMSSLFVTSTAMAADFKSVTEHAVVASQGVNGSGTISGSAASVGGTIQPHVNGAETLGVNASSILADATSVADAAGQSYCPNDESASQLSGTYLPGVYCWDRHMTSRGEIIIDGDNVANSQHVFVVEGTSVFRSGTTMKFINGASACKTIFVLKGASKIEAAELGGNFIGNVTVTQLAGSTVTGRIISTTSFVVIDGIVDNSACLPETPEPVIEEENEPQVNAVINEQPVAVVERRVPTVKATPRKPVCSSYNSKIKINGLNMSSAKIGARKVKASKAGTLINFKVDTRLFAAKTKKLKVNVTFKTNATKTFTVTVKKCGKTKKKVVRRLAG